MSSHSYCAGIGRDQIIGGTESVPRVADAGQANKKSALVDRRNAFPFDHRQLHRSPNVVVACSFSQVRIPLDKYGLRQHPHRIPYRLFTGTDDFRQNDRPHRHSSRTEHHRCHIFPGCNHDFTGPRFLQFFRVSEFVRNGGISQLARGDESGL